MTTDRLRAMAAALAAAGTTPRPESPKERTRARLLQAAETLFRRHGYRRTSVDDVAREAGVAKGTVYVHFATKAELLLHAVAAEKQRLVSRVLPAFAEGLTPEARLRAYLEALVEILPHVPLTARLMEGDRELLAAFEDLGPDAAGGILQMQQAFVEALLEELVPDPETRRARGQVLLAVLYNLPGLLDPRFTGDARDPGHGRTLVDVLLGGVRA